MYRSFKSRNNRNRKAAEEMPNSGEMVQLHEIADRNSDTFYFDGILSYGQIRRSVQNVPFEILSIGGYEDTGMHTIGKNLWIQSILGGKCDVWYRLQTPAVEYRRFYEPFLWMADFAKHLVDYLHDHKRVSLIDLKERFHQWLVDTHGNDMGFQQWLNMRNGNTDFRAIAAVHVPYLFNQAAQLDHAYAKHPLWEEIHPWGLNAVPLQLGCSKDHQKDAVKRGDTLTQHKTVVTPYVYEMFNHLPFARCFEVVHGRQSLINRDLKLFDNTTTTICASQNHAAKTTDSHSVCIGNVVAVRSDLGTAWKTHDKLWYGYVQGIKQTKIGQKLNLIWLYRPSDTPCQSMRYPHTKELFLSDHCNCGDGPIYAHEVASKPRVAFFEGPECIDTDFFVRQKYAGSSSAWETLKKSDFTCDCGVEAQGLEYQIGDTLLVARKLSSSKNRVLEPVVLLEKAPNGLTKLIRVRLLHRLGRDIEGSIRVEPNELVYTSVLENIPVADVHRRCHIRFYTKDENDQGKIPAPYCRKGTADCFYITHQVPLDQGKELEPLTKPWPLQFNQGWDPSAVTSKTKLRGLDIFCGGGSLGRGLEEGGAVKFEWAVDYFKEAIHTYKANLNEHSHTKLFYGSVNDFLRQAIQGRGGRLVAQAGEVEVISAGSPCQGFSLANQRRWNDQSLLNVSMVASVVSYIDFYRPKYAFLENVLGMAKCGVDGKQENVFAQVLCALVGMGYQVRPGALDAWSFGSPQSRTRLFINITAPGLTLLPDPPQSHSHPVGISARSLGKTANGLPLGSRYWDTTPFEYVTIGEATEDLPSLDGKTSCIQFPDHRVVRQTSSLNRVRISCVPRFPRGMSFVKAARRGLMPPPQMEALDSVNKIRSSAISRSYQRVNPDALIPTITTGISPEDGISGTCVHWNDNRLITVMEARRAQGVPDHEVIVGTPAMQWKIIGNSVARPVALGLGMSLRAAWLEDSTAAAKSASASSAAEEVIPQIAAKPDKIGIASHRAKLSQSGPKITSLFGERLKFLPSDTTKGHSNIRYPRSSSPLLRNAGKGPTFTHSEISRQKRTLQAATRRSPPFPPNTITMFSKGERPILSHSEPQQKNLKFHVSIPRPSSFPRETVIISSESESDTPDILSTITGTSLTTTRETTSSETNSTKTLTARNFKR